MIAVLKAKDVYQDGSKINLAGTDGFGVAGWLDNYCRANPIKTLYEACDEFVSERIGAGKFIEYADTPSSKGRSSKAGFASGNTLCTAWDFGAMKFWGRVGSGNWNNDIIANQDPANGIGGVSFSSLSTLSVAAALGTNIQNDAATFNMGATAFAQTMPSGFISWDAAINAQGATAAGWQSTIFRIQRPAWR